MKKTANSTEETKKLAKATAGSLKGSQTLGLIGDLGAGKTVFVQGLAEALGIKKQVISPTFNLMKIYEIKKTGPIKKLIHVDAYRLTNGQELLEIGLDEYFNQSDCLVVIEWADKVRDILPAGSLILNFAEGQTENQRIIEIKTED
ncbi:MAG: tRNA (adenosine(37)-N6)-threonylcarbamoyltransferase complex ATPase subunit type 1 TsaE [Candidatus Komeilibacteria bacterium CG10_big_fil_rev_8_21_14_0_10_41_13]|uniref:tRNA threonylcarbamoyladenosine biosynthesis protein TsaE n=1 Tax=Candidatus Komeilibacteria bacterium CG10_big_fil_rev_8_21_14_0_10_41_13 TaxID=1974476 RepID=A0A2M6WBQ4_9BACT|nr:MAG: tRNA (adenosine(37)-N6)-threonylcarbamoyltransferase complex ATPase subunit type 1 TsaE [Candidatus Komeilibacteria bacterium CG10_big_fil_rev_8_21_14_0_10_41_13]